MRASDFRIEQDELGFPVFLFRSPSSDGFVKVPLHENKKRAGIGTRNDLLFRALGRSSSAHPQVLDLTAGLLRDSLHIIDLGYQVTALERDPVLAHALSEWLAKSPIEQLKLVHADAFTYLNQMHEPPDIIYMDPMFPELGSSALSGKEAQLLKKLVGSGDESESAELLKLARQKCKWRVVVKRPRKAGLLLPKPKSQVIGKSTRYDIY